MAWLSHSSYSNFPPLPQPILPNSSGFSYGPSSLNSSPLSSSMIIDPYFIKRIDISSSGDPILILKDDQSFSFSEISISYRPETNDETAGIFSQDPFTGHTRGVIIAVGRQNIMKLQNDVNSAVAAHKSKPAAKVSADSLSKVVLPAELKEEIVAVINQSNLKTKIFDDWGLGETIEYGRGQTMLFWGQPGTGKTFCARAIADALSLPLMSVSTAELESSEPGAMERNVKEVFAEAKQKKAVLLLDECDSLVFSRENMGMILGAQINALLTEIEKYEGILVLSTNRINKLDKALERRISLIVEFPFPTEPQRDLIWQKIIPSKLPLESDVLTSELAKFEFTGGQIKNVLLGAARLAAHEGKDKVALDHFFRAASRLAEGTSAFNRTTSSLNDHREAYSTSTQEDLGPVESTGVSRGITKTKTTKPSTDVSNK